MRKNVLAFVALLLLAGLCRRYYWNQGEDFMYYYCAGWVHQQGQSIYDPASFQGCIERVMGRANPNLARGVSSAYPPAALLLFAPLARLPFSQAFAVWTLAIFLGALLVFRRFEEDEAAPFLILAHPALILSVAYHKLSLLLIACLLWGVEWTRRGREAWGGALMGALVFQPHYLLAVLLLLALQRRWRVGLWALSSAGALAAAAAAFGGGGLAAWRQWAASATRHAQDFVTLDNQSLFVAWFKPARHWSPSPPLIEAVRFAAPLAILAWAVWSCRRRPLEKRLGWWLALMLLALPYSHGSDNLWALPLYFETLRAIQDRFALSRRVVVCAALALSAALALPLGAYRRLDFTLAAAQIWHGYLTLGLVFIAAFLRRGEASRPVA